MPVGDDRIGGVRQVDEEGFVRFVRRVAVDADRERLAGHARGEGQRARRAHVIGCRRRAGRGGVGHGNGPRGRRRERHGEHRAGRPAVALGDGDVVD